MFIDSQITESIIKTFVEHNFPILSVHNSFIVQFNQVGLLRDAMSKATKNLVGRDLAVKQEVLGYDDVMNMKRIDNDLNMEPFNKFIAMSDRTDQYSDRILKFMKFRRDNFHETYWIGKTPGEQ
jgi:hypothetical protein